MNTTPMTLEELQALHARQSNAGLWWELSAEEVALRCRRGRRDFRGANLEGAYLRGAYLRGAYLGGAYLVNVPGVYSAFSPFLSSRGDELQGGLALVGGAIELRFWAGCQEALTADFLRNRVKRSHGDNIHAKHYEAAISFIEASFAIDMVEGKWAYLLTWNEDHPAPVAPATE